MRGLKLAALTAATLLMGLATAGGAQAAYQDPAISVSVDGSTLYEGDTFTVRATSAADCAWTDTFEGSSKEGAGTSFSATFTAPPVDERTEYPATVSCTFDDTAPVVAPAETGTNLVTPAAIQTATRTVTITVLPVGSSGDSGDSGDSGVIGGDDTSDAGGLLPTTGGTSVDLLWIGGALVLVGAATTVAVRRRRHA